MRLKKSSLKQRLMAQYVTPYKVKAIKALSGAENSGLIGVAKNGKRKAKDYIRGR